MPASRPARSAKVARKATAKAGLALKAAIPKSRRGTADTPGSYMSHAGWKRGRRTPARHAHRAHRPRRAQGVEMELALYGIEGQGWFLSFHCIHTNLRQ